MRCFVFPRAFVISDAIIRACLFVYSMHFIFRVTKTCGVFQYFILTNLSIICFALFFPNATWSSSSLALSQHFPLSHSPLPQPPPRPLPSYAAAIGASVRAQLVDDHINTGGRNGGRARYVADERRQKTRNQNMG
jgi:hypothetical protein